MESSFPKRLVIVRHAESERNLERERIEKYDSNELMLPILKRDPDVRLTPKGKLQAEITGKALKQEFGNFDIAFASPYVRTQQTAEIILNIMGRRKQCDYRLEERLREKDWGILDLLTKKGIQQRYPEEYARKEREGKYYYRPPGGESYPDVGLRLYSFLGSMMRSGGNKNVLVVTHSVVVKMFRKNLEKLTEQYVLKIDAEDETKNCGVTFYLQDPKTNKLKLQYYNQVFYKI